MGGSAACPEVWALLRMGDYEMVEISEGFPGVLGYSREELLGKRTGGLGLWRDSSQRLLFLSRLQQDGKVENLEAWLRRAGGDFFPALLSAECIRLNGQSYVLVIGRDISGQRRTEAALACSEARFRQVFDHAPSAMALIGLDGRFLEVNAALTGMLGRPRADLVGRHFSEINHPEDRSTGSDPIAALAGGQRSMVEFERCCRRGDGTVIHVRGTAALMSDEADGAAFFIVHVQDVTAQRAAEADREKLDAHLRQSAKLEAVATLAGGVAHDFNNLLMGIQGNVSLLRLDSNGDAAQKKRLDDIEALVASAKSLTGQLLGFARSGKYEPQIMDLNRLVRETVGLFSHSHRQMTVQTDLADDLWAARIDRIQFSQALMNLFVNAWQAMKDGGLLRLTTANVTFGTAEACSLKVSPGDYVCLNVIDNGAGMDPETLDKVFDPFFSTRTFGNGAGLGLAATYGTVRQHGGIIQVRSRLGQGSAFTIHLPAVKPPPPSTAGHRQLALPLSEQGRSSILLVDDDQMILELGTELLATMGFTVIPAAGGQAAVEVFARRHTDICLVVLDMIMPEMGGADTFDALRRIDPEVPVLLSSGFSLDDQAEAILARGCRGFIQKPFRLKELEVKIRDILGPVAGCQT